MFGDDLKVGDLTERNHHGKEDRFEESTERLEK